jgi:hypothetical protein
MYTQVQISISGREGNQFSNGDTTFSTYLKVMAKESRGKREENHLKILSGKQDKKHGYLQVAGSCSGRTLQKASAPGVGVGKSGRRPQPPQPPGPHHPSGLVLPTSFAAVYQEGALLAHKGLWEPCPLGGHFAGVRGWFGDGTVAGLGWGPGHWLHQNGWGLISWAWADQTLAYNMEGRETGMNCQRTGECPMQKPPYPNTWVRRPLHSYLTPMSLFSFPYSARDGTQGLA